MNRILFVVLGGIATTLSGVIVAEISMLRLEQTGFVPKQRNQFQGPRPVGERIVSDQLRTWAETALSRPLFSPTRRPVAGAGGANGVPRLSGILVSPSGRRAIFAGPTGGKSLVLTEGGEIDAYTVTAIGTGQVILASPGGNRVLRPSFDPALRAGAAPPQGAFVAVMPDLASQPAAGVPQTR